VITINGQLRELPDGTSVVEVVTEVVGAPETRGVAVAVNGEVVPRTSWATTAVAAGDRVEVLTATQGG
jgi:sulfur carrier protein